MLICLRGQNNSQFEKSKKKGQKALIWKKVTDEMKQDGYYFDARQCDEKWRRLLSRFRQVRDLSKKSGSGGIKWQYYELMSDTLSPLARQAVSPPKGKIEYIIIHRYFFFIFLHLIILFCVLTVTLGSLIFLCLVLIIFLLEIIIF